MLRKSISLIVSLLLILQLAAVLVPLGAEDPGMPFRDVKEGKWYYENINYVYTNGLMTGMTTDTFVPNGTLTRAMIVTILCRMEKGTEETTDKFSDVKSGAWYAGYVGWAAKTGVVDGYPDGTFRPDKAITRQEMAAVMSRYIEYSDVNMPRQSTAPVVFTDDDKIASWAEEYVETLRRAGIFNGDSNGNVNPASNITRAETATIIKNYFDAVGLAWQGYVPDPEDDGYAVYSASYLYYNGTAVSGGLGTELYEDESTGYDILKAYPDDKTASYHSTPSNSTGICTSVFEDLDLDELPVVKVCYTYEGETEPDSLTGKYIVNPCSNSWSMQFFNAYVAEDITFTKGTDDDGYQTMTYDLTPNLTAHSNVNDDIDLSHVLMTPFEEGYNGGGQYVLRYIAFFRDQASADAFSSADLDDYLKNYFCYAGITYEEVTDEKMAEYDKLLVDRIEEIVESESAVTPAEIEKNGGTCFYVSSISGKAGNDGKSVKTPFAKPDDLFIVKAGGLVWQSKMKSGDAAFFERGSIFYPERYGESSLWTLSCIDGGTYAAYGDGPKPVFTCAVDLSEENNTGTWLKTDWDNVWVLDSVDKNNPQWIENGKDDIGNIFFNDGEALGVRVVPNDEDDPYGKGKTTYDYGLMTADGENYFMSGGTSCENPGTAMKNNYEFMYVKNEGKLYLYWDKGNPADSFRNIWISRFGFIISGNHNCLYDNLCTLYSSAWAIRIAEVNSTIQNCEIGCVGGELSSIASGAELYGEADGIYMINNYCHDIADGPLSVQDATDDTVDASVRIVSKNVDIHDNVIVACGNGVELWIKPGVPINEDGEVDRYSDSRPQHRSENYNIHDNIMAYIGYGISIRQEEKRLGTVFCTRYEMINSKIENNLVMYCNGQVGIVTFSSDEQKYGYELINNTYVLDPDYIVMGDNYRDNLNSHWYHNLAGYGIGVTVPYSYRYLTYMASLGIGNGETYYYYDAQTEENDQWAFFMTGYHLYH